MPVNSPSTQIYQASKYMSSPNLPPVGARLQRQDGGIITSLEQLHEKINEMRDVFNSLENKLQALASELKTGFTEAMQELSRIQHGEYALEEKVKSCRCTMEERVSEMKNSLNYFKEELSNAMSMIQAITTKQEEMQQKIEQLQQEKRRESRKVKTKKTQKEEHASPAGSAPTQVPESRPAHVADSNVKGIMGPGVNAATPETEENLKSCLSADVQTKGPMTPGLWRQPKDSKEWSEEYGSKDHSDKPKEAAQGRHSSLENVLCETSLSAKRQTVALELLESERKYVINISLVLKIKATFQGSDGKRSTKERSLFPGSLRYLVQQHLDLLHALQERVLKWPRQGVLGDLFLKLTNDENNFLDYYVAYLRDLPECISLVHVVVLKEAEEEIKSDLYTLFFHIVQRIPEYLIHLQNVLKFTEQEHPDYYLLLVCVQRLRVFISHYTLLFQCNEDLLIQKRKKLKKSSMVKLYKGLASQSANTGQDTSSAPGSEAVRDSGGIHSEEILQPYPAATSPGSAVTHLMPQVKKSQQQTLMENIQPGKPCDWEMEGRKHERPENLLAPTQFCTSEQDLKSLAAPLQAIPEMDYDAALPDPVANLERSIRAPAELLSDSRTFVPSYEEFEYGGEIFTLPAPYEEETFQSLPLFEACSPASSESSLDICFLRPVSFTMEPERTEHSVQPLPKSSTSPVSSSTYKHEAVHGKTKPLSRSLKEFPRTSTSEGVTTRLYSTRSSSGSRVQLKQERTPQPHITSATARSSPRNFFPPQRTQSEKQTYLEEIHVEDNTRFCPKEERECEQTSFSDQHPSSRDQKGGFRSSFRKLFKKKSSGSEYREKTNENPSVDPSPTKQDFFRNQLALANDLDQGTAV
uniref:Rho guanine nucleotide exchange factor 33 n=1 Tax=Monodelphis domestica TaxID=13616 RepID=F6PRP1_MONDO